MMRIVMLGFDPCPVSNTTKNRYNFVVAQPPVLYIFLGQETQLKVNSSLIYPPKCCRGYLVSLFNVFPWSETSISLIRSNLFITMSLSCSVNISQIIWCTLLKTMDQCKLFHQTKDLNNGFLLIYNSYN